MFSYTYWPSVCLGMLTSHLPKLAFPTVGSVHGQLQGEVHGALRVPMDEVAQKLMGGLLDKV